MANVSLLVQMTLDRLPVDMHTPESAQQIVENLLVGLMPKAYNPKVSTLTSSESEVVANPFARHNMLWDNGGSGLCVQFVARPSGKKEDCNETYDSPVHGGSRTVDHTVKDGKPVEAEVIKLVDRIHAMKLSPVYEYPVITALCGVVYSYEEGESFTNAIEVVNCQDCLATINK